MPMFITQNIRKILVILTVPAVMWLFFNQLANWHYHVLPNGIVIEHAHPFTNNQVPGAPYQNHNHTDFEYTVLGLISSITGLIILTFILSSFLVRPWKRLLLPATQVLFPPQVSKTHLQRGPPVFSV